MAAVTAAIEFFDLAGDTALETRIQAGQIKLANTLFESRNGVFVTGDTARVARSYSGAGDRKGAVVGQNPITHERVGQRSLRPAVSQAQLAEWP